MLHSAAGAPTAQPGSWSRAGWLVVGKRWDNLLPPTRGPACPCAAKGSAGSSMRGHGVMPEPYSGSQSPPFAAVSGLF